jgi:superfamily II DNA helicase RecQ
MLTILGL